MAAKKFLKGPQLFALARKKASILGLDSKGVTLEELILKVQDKEGHTPCFRMKKTCSETMCCWQISCGATK